MVTIHEAGFQTVAIFMQNGELEKKEPAKNAVSDNVEDSSNKVEIIALNLLLMTVGKTFYIENEYSISFSYLLPYSLFKVIVYVSDLWFIVQIKF